MPKLLKHQKLHPHIRKGIYRARETHKQEDIAREIGTTPRNFSNFMRGATLGEGYTYAAKEWLEKHSYWDVPATLAETAHTDPMDAIALTIERMLPSIKSSSGLPLKVRTNFFKKVMQAVDEELYPLAQALAAEDRPEYSPTPDSDAPG